MTPIILGVNAANIVKSYKIRKQDEKKKNFLFTNQDKRIYL